MKTNNNTKVCEVCGDKAFCKNFGVICCMPCKAFFRRNAFNYKKFVCLKNDNCLISVETRTECQKCRIEKCFKVGMIQDLIQRRDEKKITTNSQLEKSDCNSQTNSSDNTITSNSLTLLSNESQEDIWELIDDIIDSDCNTDSSNDVFTQTVVNINTINTSLPPISKPLTDYNGLKQLEFQRISEVITASTVFMSPLSKNIYKINDLSELRRLLIQMSENDIQNVIVFAKSISGFRDMCPEDKYWLFKYGCNEIIDVRCLPGFNESTQTIMYKLDNDNTVALTRKTLTKLNSVGWFQLVMNIYMGFMNKVLPEWQWDLTVLNLLSAILLFNPNRENLINRTIIRLERQLYIYLLQRYLLLKCGSESESQLKVQKLMISLKDLEISNEIQRRNTEEMQNRVELYGPLIRDLYDLKLD